jgi:LmbE family N-acetylglucosaminyl deacetylase
MECSRLVISPHVDDEVLGCGGILDGKSHVIECGVDDFHIVSRDERLRELTEAAEFLGFSFSILNNKVNNYNKRDLIDDITVSINSMKPSEVFIPYPSYNQDHTEVYLASLIALRPHDMNHFVSRVFIYEETQVMDWDYSFSLNSTFKPNYFRKIDVEKKVTAYRMLKSQVREFRSPEYIRSIASIRGKQSGFEFAEAFQCIRFVDDQ